MMELLTNGKLISNDEIMKTVEEEMILVRKNKYVNLYHRGGTAEIEDYGDKTISEIKSMDSVEFVTESKVFLHHTMKDISELTKEELKNIENGWIVCKMYEPIITSDYYLKNNTTNFLKKWLSLSDFKQKLKEHLQPEFNKNYIYRNIYRNEVGLMFELKLHKLKQYKEKNSNITSRTNSIIEELETFFEMGLSPSINLTFKDKLILNKILKYLKLNKDEMDTIKRFGYRNGRSLSDAHSQETHVEGEKIMENMNNSYNNLMSKLSNLNESMEKQL